MERVSEPIRLNVVAATKLITPFTQDEIAQLTLLSAGCANTHYKVEFKKKQQPVVIRIYTREPSTLAREMAIQQLISGKIPIPQFLYSDDQCSIFPYPYAIIEWVEARLMRDIVICREEKAIKECCLDAGKYLNLLRQIRFIQAGFFDASLKIRPFDQNEDFLFLIFKLLDDVTVRENLEPKLQQAVYKLVQDYSDCLPNFAEANLTHADFDPANILVHQIKGRWQVAAILDWEFSFSGNYLLDVGLMLRYSHKLPSVYEESFIAGLAQDGIAVPANWKKQAKLLDVLCLLQLLQANGGLQRPKLKKDVVALIRYIVNAWSTF